MKKFVIAFLFIIMQTPSFSAPQKMVPSGGDNFVPNIFIYSIPETETKEIPDTDEADSINESVTEPQAEELAGNVYATTLKGYAQYVEDNNEIYLKDDYNNFVLNIKQPQKISSSGIGEFRQNGKKPTLQYNSPEYSIAPASIKTTDRAGDFTFGAMYGNDIDNSTAMLETETGLFTKYERSKFALNSSVTKSLNTTNAIDYNTFSIAPELKVNNYLSLKNVMSADVTRNRRSSALIFSLNPFGKKDVDRMRLELGAKQTYFLDTSTNKTEFSFSTVFKL